MNNILYHHEFFTTPEGRVIDARGVRDLARDLIDKDGQFKIMPEAYYFSTTQMERSLFCIRNGVYALHTTETVEYLRRLTDGMSAIEIGAGNGVLAKALGIPATDNRLQERSDVAAYLSNNKQAPVRYGDNIEKLDGIEAIKKYRPQVVIGSWISHLYRAENHHLGGNMFAPDEYEILESCEFYVMIGNGKTHQNHPLMKIQHQMIHGPDLYSRGWDNHANFIGIWKGAGQLTDV